MNRKRLSHGQKIAPLFGVTTPMRRLLLAVVLAVAFGTPPVFAAGGKMPDKVDKALAGALKSGAKTQKVLITVEPGSRGAIRSALEKGGRKIKREHPSLNLLVTELSAAEVLELVKNKKVKALSLDGPVRAHQDLLTAPIVDDTAPVYVDDTAPVYEDPLYYEHPP